jgi:hypothetical protein
VSKADKIKIYKTKVKQVVVYGSETRATIAMGEKRLGTWERIILRRICGNSDTARKWTARTN